MRHLIKTCKINDLAWISMNKNWIFKTLHISLFWVWYFNNCSAKKQLTMKITIQTSSTNCKLHQNTVYDPMLVTHVGDDIQKMSSTTKLSHQQPQIATNFKSSTITIGNPFLTHFHMMLNIFGSNIGIRRLSQSKNLPHQNTKTPNIGFFRKRSRVRILNVCKLCQKWWILGIMAKLTIES